jgi:galactoside O-acetyltransferase
MFLNEEEPCPDEFAHGEVLPLAVAARWLKYCGRGVKIYQRSRLIPPDRISIGDFSQIDEGVRIFGGAGVAMGRHVHMAFGSSISGGGTAILYDFVGIGAGVRLITGTEVIDGGGLTNPTVPTAFRTVRRGKIEIGAHSVVFTNTIILPDVLIGEGAVIGAGSIVHRSLKPWSIYAGNPLVQIGTREREGVVRRAHELSQQEQI